MLMFAVVLFFSLLGLAILSIPFWLAILIALDPVVEEPQRKPVPRPARSRFFADRTPPRVPVEALLTRIEDHVRLEQAAARSFLESPTSALLHSRSLSPLVQ